MTGYGKVPEEEYLAKLKKVILEEAWQRVSKDIMMFDYPRHSWAELERKIKEK